MNFPLHGFLYYENKKKTKERRLMPDRFKLQRLLELSAQTNLIDVYIICRYNVKGVWKTQP